MKGEKLVFDRTSGKFVPGQAAPRLLDEELRKLPGDLVTMEHTDPDRIHPLDPEHVRETIIEDRIAAQKASKKPTPQDVLAGLEDKDPTPKLTQRKIDIIRARVLLVRLLNMEHAATSGVSLDPYLQVAYLYFPQDDYRIRELQERRPPPPSERPPHLRNFNLYIDVLHWPRAVSDILAPFGFKSPNLAEFAEWKKSYELSLEMESAPRDSILMDS